MTYKYEIPPLDDLFGGAEFVSAKSMAKAFETTEVTIWRWSKSGRLPKPYRLGQGTTRWRVSEVRSALSKLAA